MMMTAERIIRVALYPRVSTEEQVLHGASLEAQEAQLVAYAKEHGYKIVGIYRDEGNSARQPITKRKVVLQLLEDVMADKIDLILFIKLDRWTRNVEAYHTVQKVLDAHNVSWQATMEDYETITANGRFKVNIMLSVNESESDRTSERIKFVFENKVRKGEVIFPPQSVPFGYRIAEIDGKRKLVKDEEAREAVETFFQLLDTKSINQAGLETNKIFGIDHLYARWQRMTKNEIYAGTYRGVDGFCEPYITKEHFMRLKTNKNWARKAAGDRVYIFSGMIRCPSCGALMTAKWCTGTSGGKKEYHYYRCQTKEFRHCTTKTISEKKVEKYLLENVRRELEDYILKAEVAQAQPRVQKKKDETAKLKERLRRLNVSYQAGNMEDDEYLEKSAALKDAIAKTEQPEKDAAEIVDIGALRSLLSADFEDVYITFSNEEKQVFWRSIVQEIHYDGKNLTDITFKT